MPVVEMLASAFLGALFQSLIPKMNYDKFLDFCRTATVHSEAKSVMKLLQTIERVLDVAEERQFDDVPVKVWVDDVRDVAYDLEVILDKFDTYELQRHLGIAGAIPSKVKFIWKFGSQVKDIVKRLQDIRDRMQVLDLKPVSGMTGGSSAATSERIREKRESVSGLTDSGLFVRDVEKQKLLELVKNAAVSNTDSKRRVIAVVGTAGMGKTTLAQRVYQYVKESKSFNMNVWVCVSDQFKLTTIMEKILREIGGDSSENKSLQEIHKKIEDTINGKTLFVVLDDAWERSHTEWEHMWSLLHGAKQIIVVLTTRDMEVASSSGAFRNEIFLLDKLSDEDCLSVFQHYAFANEYTEVHPKLKNIGVQIAKKCDGSPLAAKVLGGILRCKSTEPEWNSVLGSKFLTGENNSIRSILILSYYHLHMPLKRCFAFVAIFPKKYEFGEREIVLLWMAQGFLPHSDQKEMEDVGHEYFHDLLSRSFFQPSPNKIGTYVLHDLIHDLAQEVAGKTCFRLEEMMGADQINRFSSTTRYASYTRCKHDTHEKIRAFERAHSLQTFIPIIPQELEYKTFSYHIVHDILYKLCQLRVLSLREYKYVHELPHSITKLKHLRYLDLSYTELEILPTSICRLVNLQTLLLRGCCRLFKLSEDFSNLVNIRHLDISGSTRIMEMPFGMNNLKSLRALSDFVVGTDIRCGIQQLKVLNQINGSLCISKLENVSILGDASEAMLKEKTKLRTLTMRWSNSNNDSNFQAITENVLEELCPPQNLQKLTVEMFMGTKFPRWMGDSSFSNMTSLSLRFCEKCTCLPPLGKLPTLKHLHIKAFKAIVKVDSNFCGEFFTEPFFSLKTLKFEDMPEWEDWFISDEVRVFPCLQMLCIYHCPKLSRKLPEELLELEELVIRDCKSLVASIPRTLKLKKLEVDGCKEVSCNNLNDWSSLYSFILKNIETLSITEELKLELKELENVETDCLELLPRLSRPPMIFTRMSLVEYSELKEIPCRLKELIIKNCSLEKLPHVLAAKESFFKLEVFGCPNLISFPDEIDFSNDRGDSNSTLVIDISDCPALEYIPVFKIVNCRSTLVEMKIRNCRSLTSFAKGLLPVTLRKLSLDYCYKLKCLVVMEEENKSNSDMFCPNIQLDKLWISNCNSLEYLASSTRGELPFRVKKLGISYCWNLKSFIVSPQSSSSLLEELPEELENLMICSCPELKDLAESFHINSNKVQYIRFSHCNSLKCLPKGLHNVSSLKYLSVKFCEELEASSLPMGCGIGNLVNNQLALETLEITGWPGGNASLLNDGFQRINTTLTSLSITYPNKSGRSVNNPISDWGLSRLVSLQELKFVGELDSDVVYFPKSINSSALPSSLTRFHIQRFTNMKYLSCQVFKNLASLQVLWISACPKLESFRNGGLPLSLLELRVLNCPKLEQMYKNKNKMKAKDWSKISHIPDIKMNLSPIEDLWLENNDQS